MKKTYISPDMQMVAVALEQMISISPNGSGTSDKTANPDKDVLIRAREMEAIEAEGAEEDLW